MAVRSKTRRWQEAFGTREVRGRGFEDRRPKVEDRKKAEFRNPKTETRGRARFGLRPSGFGLLRGRAFEVAVVRAGAIGWAAGNTLQIRVHLCSSVVELLFLGLAAASR